MAKLILHFEDRVLAECVLGSQTALIGRLPGNAVVIDNPAVSSPHARVLHDGDDFVIEDLNSRNGTFVNGKRVTRQALQHGDVVLVGKHTLVFDGMAGGEPVAAVGAEAEVEPAVPTRGATVLLDTRRHRELLAMTDRGQDANPVAAAAVSSAAPPAQAAVGVLRVLAGRADQTHYALSAHTSLIGKADTALVRLKGWFKPKVALAIARKGEVYTATPFGARTLINGQALKGRQELKDGDLLQVSGLTLEFLDKK